MFRDPGSELPLGREKMKGKDERKCDEIFFFFHTHLFSSFWTSRGHRCRLVSPPVLAFNFYRALGSAIPLVVDFSSSVANTRPRASASQIVHKKKSPRIYTGMYSGGFELTTLTYTRLEDNLIRHGGDRLMNNR